MDEIQDDESRKKPLAEQVGLVIGTCLMLALAVMAIGGLVWVVRWTAGWAW